jgi:hypothetical protein
MYKISTSEDQLAQLLDKSPIYKNIRFLNKNLISGNTSNRLLIEDTVKNLSFISEFKIINFDFIKDMEKLVSSTFDVSSLPDYYKAKWPNMSKVEAKYGEKQVYPKSSLILKKRNLAPMVINFTTTQNAMLNSADRVIMVKGFLKNAEITVVLYKEQIIKFSKAVANIDNNTEPFYDPKAKILFKTYLDVLPSLLRMQKIFVDNLAREVVKLDPYFLRSPLNSPVSS